MRLRNLLCLSAAVASIAVGAQAQTGSAPLTIRDGTGTGTGAQQTVCEYKVDGTNLAACQVKWVWTGTAWVLEQADQSGHPYVAKGFLNPALNSTLTLGATAAYQMSTTLCASTCTPSSIYFVLPTGNMSITGGVIRLNDSLANSWGTNAQIIADLWSAPVTLSSGDGGAYKIATGTANYQGSLLCTSSLGVQGDGTIFKCNVVGSTLDVALGSANAHLYATFYTPTGSGTPTAGSTLAMTLTGSN